MARDWIKECPLPEQGYILTSVPTLIEQNQLFILSLSVKNVGLSSK